MATGTNSRPEVFLSDISGYIDTRRLSTPQLQRAWCLSLARLLWPTIDPGTALTVASWLFQNRTDPADDA